MSDIKIRKLTQKDISAFEALLLLVEAIRILHIVVVISGTATKFDRTMRSNCQNTTSRSGRSLTEPDR